MATTTRIRRRSTPLFDRLLFPLLVLMLAGASLPLAAQELTNGSFDHWNAEGHPEGWSVQSRGVTIEPESQPGDRQRVLKVSDSDDEAGGSAFIKQTMALGEDGFPGATLRGWIRSRNVAPSATLVVILEGPEGRIFLDDMRDRVVHGDTPWREYTISIPASREAVSLTVGMLAMGSGTAWFDDLALSYNAANTSAEFDAREYMIEAWSVLRERYLDQDAVDWDLIRRIGLDALPEDATPAQTHAAVSMMLEALDDPHTGFNRPGRAPGSETVSQPRAWVETEVVAEGIARIRVPAVPGSTSDDAGVRFAENAHEQLASIDASATCGWIVDLRDNTGGNMWPMLAAIGPIAGPGTLGRFIGPAGDDATVWSYREGVAAAVSDSGRKERLSMTTEPYQPSKPHLPVAVLVSGRTSSSGEAIAVAFMGRENTRLFGTETGGLATANVGYPLPDGAVMAFPIGYMADRLGNRHYPAVEPHQVVEPEKAEQAAIDWLQSQPACMH